MDLFLIYLGLALPTVSMLFIAYACKLHQTQTIYFASILGLVLFNTFGTFNIVNDPVHLTERFFYSYLILNTLFYLSFFFNLYFARRLNKVIPVTFYDRTSHNHMALYCLIFFSLTIVALYVSRHGLPPAFAFSLDGWSGYAAREEKWGSLAEGTWVYRLGFYTLPSIICVYFYILKKQSNTKLSKFLFYSSLAIAAPLALAMAQKSPIVGLIITLFIASLLFSKKHEIILKSVLLVLGLSFLISLLLWSYYPERALIGSSQNIIAPSMLELVVPYINHRILGSYIYAHAIMLNSIPLLHDFFYVDVLANPAGLFPNKPVALSRLLDGWAGLSGKGNNASPAFSQLYAGFGMLGVAATPFIMHLAITTYQLLFKWLPSSPMVLSAYIAMAYQLMSFSFTGIYSSLGPELLIILAILIAIELVANMLKSPEKILVNLKAMKTPTSDT